MPEPTQSPYDEQLKLLFEYTKFHIGLYTGLVTLFIGVLAFGGDQIPADLFWCAKLSIVFIAFAGMCGGVVVSNIPEHQDFDNYWKCESLPLSSLPLLKRVEFKTKDWATAEHVFFWMAILVVVVPVLLADSSTWNEPRSDAPSCCPPQCESVDERTNQSE